MSSSVSQQLRTILICDRTDLVVKAMTCSFALTRAQVKPCFTSVNKFLISLRLFYVLTQNASFVVNSRFWGIITLAKQYCIKQICYLKNKTCWLLCLTFQNLGNCL
jgi:hypothetical protein